MRIGQAVWVPQCKTRGDPPTYWRGAITGFQGGGTVSVALDGAVPVLEDRSFHVAQLLMEQSAPPRQEQILAGVLNNPPVSLLGSVVRALEFLPQHSPCNRYLVVCSQYEEAMWWWVLSRSLGFDSVLFGVEDHLSRPVVRSCIVIALREDVKQAVGSFQKIIFFPSAPDVVPDFGVTPVTTVPEKLQLLGNHGQPTCLTVPVPTSTPFQYIVNVLCWGWATFVNFHFPRIALIALQSFTPMVESVQPFCVFSGEGHALWAQRGGVALFRPTEIVDSYTATYIVLKAFAHVVITLDWESYEAVQRMTPTSFEQPTAFCYVLRDGDLEASSNARWCDPSALAPYLMDEDAVEALLPVGKPSGPVVQHLVDALQQTTPPAVRQLLQSILLMHYIGD